MKKTKIFRSIVVRNKVDRHFSIDIGDKAGAWMDEVYDLLPYLGLTFYGIPSENDEKTLIACENDDFGQVVKIGELTGVLIPCREIINRGHNPYILCDDNSEDLEYVFSALSDEDAPLNEDTGDPYLNVFYIDEFIIEEEYRNKKIGTSIIAEIPFIVLREMYVMPDIIAYLPAMIEHESEEPDERKQALMRYAAEKISKSIEGVSELKEVHKTEEKVIPLPVDYNFSEDEINMVMGRRNSGSTYPDHVRNKALFNFYIKNGFVEIGESGLLIKNLIED